jgi:phosphoribosylformylglycinamidine (FGAM) synthase PurS component
MKKQNQSNPFDGLVLDPEEQALEDALESCEFAEVAGSELGKTKQMLMVKRELFYKLI